MRKRIVKAVGLMMMAFMMIFTNIAGVYASEGQGAGSKATFTFEGGETDGTTSPVDPEHPEYIIDPDTDESGGNGITGNTGALRIDYVSNFSFGSQAIKAGSQQFHAALISAGAEHTEDGTIEVPNFVQVSDLRGTGQGWTLSVKQDDQFRVKGGAHDGRALTGARLILDNIETNTAMEEDEVIAPNRSITFDVMDAYQEIMVAEGGNGLGTHVAHFGAYDQGQKTSALTSVTLDVPGGITKIEAPYTTTLTWTLSTVPGNGDGGEEDDGEEEEDLGKDIDDTDEGGTIDIDGDEFIILEKNEEEGTAEVMMKDRHLIRPYHTSVSGWRWSTSNLRSFLNSTYKNSLPEHVVDRIVSVQKSTNRPGQAHNIAGETIDENIYLLSVDEYNKYKPILLKYYKTSEAAFWLRSPGMNTTEAHRMVFDSGVMSLDQAGINSYYPCKPVFTIQYKKAAE